MARRRDETPKPVIDAPLLITPRLDPKPWGGSRLAELGYALDGSGGSPGHEPLGEVVMTATGNRVAAGPHAGRTLGELIAADPEALIGPRGLAATGGRPLFPLLVKLIDTAHHLSVQVHPDDACAAAHDGVGKTEAWHVLAADPGATLFAGLAADAGLVELAAAARSSDGATAALLRHLPARPGGTLFLPAGTVHALGAGILVYELQQPCEITYRLDDWGRTGPDGAPRALHVPEALDAIDPALRPEYLPPTTVPAESGWGLVERSLLVSCAYFALDRLRLEGGATVALEAPGSPQTVTVTSGAVDLIPTPGADPTRVETGRTAVVPASMTNLTATTDAPTELLVARVP